MEPISVVIITYNEEKNIGRCLNSVKGIADEIVVVDSFSTDGTEEICLAHGARFIPHAFEGHIEQKNWAKDQASYDYVLSLDADEELSPQLQASIKELKEKGLSGKDGYYMNRLTSLCGRWIKHSWYPDAKLRLWNRHKGQWAGENPHDKFMIFQGSNIGKLSGDLKHYSFHTLDELIQQTVKFASIAAHASHKKGKKTSVFGIVMHTLGKFFKKLILNKGFLDGADGWIIAYIAAFGTCLKYSKLYMLGKDRE